MAKRARVHGSTLRPRPLEQKGEVTQRVEQQVLPWVVAGRVTVPVSATFPMRDAEAAYDRFAAGAKLGKIVLVRG
jgi:NADPH:quinone reductase-like Zn-dependent oxidoreductase